MSFETVLRETFPGSMPLSAYVGRARLVAGRHGMRPGDVLPLVASCPDELCDPLRHEIGRAWGPMFDAAGLAGVPMLGALGASAVLGHLPTHAGRGRLLCFAFGHIGLGPAGEPGECRRRGRPEPSKACGALHWALGQLESGDGSGEDVRAEALEEPAAAFLLEALRQRRDADGRPGIVGLTYAALRASTETIIGAIDSVAGDETDYLVLPGIQVHAPSGGQYVWPAPGLLREQGRRERVDLA